MRTTNMHKVYDEKTYRGMEQGRSIIFHLRVHLYLERGVKCRFDNFSLCSVHPKMFQLFEKISNATKCLRGFVSQIVCFDIYHNIEIITVGKV